MKTTKKISNFAKALVLTLIFANSSNLFSQSDTIKVTISKSNNWQTMKTIQDSVASSLYKEFGRSLELDSTLSNGCVNFINEKFYRKRLPAVKDQGYLFDSYVFDYDPIKYVPYSTYSNGIIRTIHEPKFKDAMGLFNPTKFWIEVKKVESGEYFIVISLG